MVNSGSNTASPAILPGLDAEQSKQLMQFLANLQMNKQTTPSEPSSSQTFSSAHMAGISPFQYVTSVNTVCCTCKLEGKVWIIDSGVSDHMVSDRNLLCNIKTLDTPILITLPDGNKLKVTQHGGLKVGKSLILQHTLFVPFFQFNLLSVKRLIEQLRCEVVFSATKYILQDPSLKRPLEIGRATQGLYILDDEITRKLDCGAENRGSDTLTCSNRTVNTQHKYSFTCSKSSKNANLWHVRMGHISPKKLTYIPVLENLI